MVTFDYIIKAEHGIHARPAGELVKKAQSHRCGITLRHGERHADLKKLLAVLQLGVPQGATVSIECDGADEEAAADDIKSYLQQHF